METKNKQSHVVDRWEQLYFQERRTTSTDGSGAKADILRSQMALTEFARASNM